MAQYDEKIIETFADELYKEAASIVMKMTLKWTFFGVLAGAIGGGAMGKWEDSSYTLFGAVLAGTLAGFVAYSAAKRLVFTLKLQAQTALCQAQIEKNTRKTI